MKKRILIVSSKFMKSHPRAGELTHFPVNIVNGTKLHTIRNNYEYWKKIVDEVNRGEASLEIRTWSGMPYRSKQINVKGFYKGQIGIQPCVVDADAEVVYVKGSLNTCDYIEASDGLSIEDFWNWFPKTIEDACIIHFTNKLYP